jgi:Uma2 family endonuclease
VAEFDRLTAAGILSEDDRVELLDGQINVMAPIGDNHRWILDRLTEFLVEQHRNRYRVGIQNPLRLDETNEPQPDLVLYDRRLLRRHPSPTDTYLIVEIADASLSYDQGLKVPAYASAGIRELWVIDLVRNQIHVYRDPSTSDKRYRSVTTIDRLTPIAPLAFPDLQIRLSDLL